MEKFTYTPVQLQRFVKVARDCHAEAEACAKLSRWRGAIVFIASCIEAGVLATACCCEPELRRRRLWPCQGEKPLHAWELGPLLGLAVKAGWLPSQIDERANLLDQLDGDVGGAVRFVSRLRNAALHPGNYIMTGLAADFADVAHMEPAYQVASGIADAMFEKLGDVI